MALLLTSFFAGVLTIAAPCVLPLLPVIIGGSVGGSDRKRPYIITLSLSLSVVLFTILLKASTLLISISTSTWAFLSGILVLFFGVITLFPSIWTNFEMAFGLGESSNKLLQESTKKSGIWGNVILGAALGPVFSSCSPTYALIIATILPQSFFVGFLNIIFYVFGLALMLLLISVFGQQTVKKLKWLADPRGRFKKVLGVLFVFVGISIIFGYDKRFETYLIQKGIYKVPAIELKILENIK